MTLSMPMLALLISIIGPLVAAFVGLLPGQTAHRASYAVLALSAIFGVAAGISVAAGNGLPLVLQGAPIFYNMAFGLDRLAAIFYIVITVVTFFVVIYAIPYLEGYAKVVNVRHFNLFMSLLIFGLQGVVLATNIFGFIAFWELATITSFFLIAADGKAHSQKSAVRFMAFAQVAVSAMLAGLFILSGGALLSDFSTLALITPDLPQTRLTVALILILVGFTSKAGLVPLHPWLPDAAAHASAPIAAFVSGISQSLAVYGLLRIVLFVLPDLPLWFILVMIAVGIISALVGALHAVFELNVQRLIAYTSIASLGLIFVMLGTALLAGHEQRIELAQVAVYAAILLILAHTWCVSGLYLSTGIMSVTCNSHSLEAMGGLARRMPQFSVAVCVLILTGAFMPPFGPFVSGWIFLQAVIEALNQASPILKIVTVAVLPVIGLAYGLVMFAMVKFYAIGFLGQSRHVQTVSLVDQNSRLLMPIAGLAVVGLGVGGFAPAILSQLGATTFASSSLDKMFVSLGDEQLAPLNLTMVMIVIVFALWVIRHLLTHHQHERQVHTWDGGQPITARMTYTATAFSAQLRHFFTGFLQSSQVVTTTSMIAGNPWFTQHTMSFAVGQVWYDKFYYRIKSALVRATRQVEHLIGDGLKFQLGVIFMTVIICLIVAL